MSSPAERNRALIKSLARAGDLQAISADSQETVISTRLGKTARGLWIQGPNPEDPAGVHAAFNASDPSLSFPNIIPLVGPGFDINDTDGDGLFGGDGYPRALSCTFTGDLLNPSWDGGKVTIVGKNQFDEPVTAVFDPNDVTYPNTSSGFKRRYFIFKDITSITKEFVGTVGTCSVGFWDYIFLPFKPSNPKDFFHILTREEILTPLSRMFNMVEKDGTQTYGWGPDGATPFDGGSWWHLLINS